MSIKILKKTRQEGEHRITAYTQILAECREFYEYMEQFEIYNGRVSYPVFRKIIMERYRSLPEGGNLFECSLLQNSIESMMLFYMLEEEKILDFYREACDILRPQRFCLFYLESSHLREDVLRIKKERSDEEGNEMWFPLMMRYLSESPYGKKYGYRDLEDMIAHFEKRRKLELRIIREVFGENAVILPAREYTLEQIREAAER